MIEDGDIAVMNTSQLESGAKEWFAHGRESLAHSYADYKEKYSHLDPIKQSSAIEKEISADLSRLQTHPAYMSEWRRFVVIKGAHDYDILPYQDGVRSYSVNSYA